MIDEDVEELHGAEKSFIHVTGFGIGGLTGLTGLSLIPDSILLVGFGVLTLFGAVVTYGLSYKRRQLTNDSDNTT